MSAYDPTYSTALRAIQGLANADGTEELEANISVDFHNVSPSQAQAIVAAYPDLEWDGHRSGGSEWLKGQSGRFDITLFLDTPVREIPSIATDVLKAVARSAP